MSREVPSAFEQRKKKSLRCKSNNLVHTASIVDDIAFHYPLFAESIGRVESIGVRAYS